MEIATERGISEYEQRKKAEFGRTEVDAVMEEENELQAGLLEKQKSWMR